MGTPAKIEARIKALKQQLMRIQEEYAYSCHFADSVLE